MGSKYTFHMLFTNFRKNFKFKNEIALRHDLRRAITNFFFGGIARCRTQWLFQIYDLLGKIK